MKTAWHSPVLTSWPCVRVVPSDPQGHQERMQAGSFTLPITFAAFHWWTPIQEHHPAQGEGHTAMNSGKWGPWMQPWGLSTMGYWKTTSNLKASANWNIRILSLLIQHPFTKERAHALLWINERDAVVYVESNRTSHGVSAQLDRARQ